MVVAAGMTGFLSSPTWGQVVELPGPQARPASPPPPPIEVLPAKPADAPAPNPPAPAAPPQQALQPLVPALAPADRPRWSEVLSFNISEDRLVYQCDLTVDQVRWLADNEVEIEGMPGLTSVSIRPRNFRVQNFTRTGNDLVTMTVSSSRQGLVIDYERESGERLSGVSFSGPTTDPSRYSSSIRSNSCTLTAYGREVPGERVSVEANDFTTLRKEYPHEVNRHLRPLLRRLGSDVLDVQPAAARQVLAEEAGPAPVAPADFEQQVQTLLGKLNSPRWSDRESAARELKGLGPRAAALLAKIDPKDLSAQQRVSVGVIVSDAKPLPDDEARKLRNDVHFLVDCLYLPESDVRESAIRRLQAVTRVDVAKFARVSAANLRADPDAAGEAIEALREQLVPPPQR
jgi:hypothetical protein